MDGSSFARRSRLAASVSGAALGVALLGTALPAHAAGGDINNIEAQIRNLQAELHKVKSEMARKEAAEHAAAARRVRPGAYGYDQAGNPVYLGPGVGMGLASNTQPAGTPYMNVEGTPHTTMPKLGQGSFQVGGVTVTLGGFIEAAAIYRNRTENADVSSDFNSAIPYPNSPNYHSGGEFRESARQSRLSILAQGNPNENTNLAAYYEMDWQSSGASSNSRASNSYTLRIRNLYATYFRKDWDFEFLAGQNWTMLTMNKVGIKERQEDTPLVIDASYVPGFSWKRQVGFRFVKGFDHSKYHVGLSFEEPQESYSGTAPTNVGTITTTGAGVQTNNATTGYTDDIAPDIIAKITADPGWGHYEVFGVTRFLHNRVTSNLTGHNNTVVAGGGGAGMILPLIKGKLDFQLSGLVGDGIGTYGAAGLPDATYAASGAPQPLPEYQALAGMVYHPVKAIDLYAYAGTEQIMHRESFNVKNVGYGYGNPLYVNSGCDLEGSALGCSANTRGISQGTVGYWWRFQKGPFGTAQTGLQYSYTRRSIFRGVGGDPDTDISMVMLSFRYLPFQ